MPNDPTETRRVLRANDRPDANRLGFIFKIVDGNVSDGLGCGGKASSYQNRDLLHGT